MKKQVDLTAEDRLDGAESVLREIRDNATGQIQDPHFRHWAHATILAYFAAEWPTASCCGEPRVSREVDACHDHAHLCEACGTNPTARMGQECPWCANAPATEAKGHGDR